MTNNLSFNQMAHWKHDVNYNSQENKIDEYFECLIDCKDNDRMCKAYCTELLDYRESTKYLQRVA